ncbi:MarR family winged helix-turn-helix transcriptional regulator [Geodermatophilus normandii]|uniref:Winged helix-turn-helix transcriptional regulator n=1 Tax=Geodermatophilus normandii TaxID=1137989 RepID=A0A6P0GJZ6_9ACTN|nr:MarR family winged helix-turn-helix transcriptional regulator [Geodermatophilus normandii]NEM07580.1 winged helix-turn-helix transcriptional regulator [Geodermatophilus normandii]
MSDPVNGDRPVPVTVLLEQAMTWIRDDLYALSDARFPGLRMRHYRLLAMLPHDGERLSRLAAHSGLTKQALAQALAPLEAGGYVEVLPDPSDGRARLVRLTDRGREAEEAVRGRLDAVERDWARRVGEDRYAVARAVLADLAPGPAGSPAPVTVEE